MVGFLGMHFFQMAKHRIFGKKTHKKMVTTSSSRSLFFGGGIKVGGSNNGLEAPLMDRESSK